MSGFVDDVPDDNSPTDKDKNVLFLLFGNCRYHDTPLNQLFRIIGFTIILTIFLALIIYFIQFLLNPLSLIMSFFIVTFVLQLWFTRWRDLSN